jgi:hypothetical protein
MAQILTILVVPFIVFLEVFIVAKRGGKSVAEVAIEAFANPLTD